MDVITYLYSIMLNHVSKRGPGQYGHRAAVWYIQMMWDLIHILKKYVHVDWADNNSALIGVNRQAISGTTDDPWFIDAYMRHEAWWPVSLIYMG